MITSPLGKRLGKRNRVIIIPLRPDATRGLLDRVVVFNPLEGRLERRVVILYAGIDEALDRLVGHVAVGLGIIFARFCLDCVKFTFAWPVNEAAGVVAALHFGRVIGFAVILAALQKQDCILIRRRILLQPGGFQRFQ